MSKAQNLMKMSRKARRGASMVEYALLIIGVMFAAAVLMRQLGKSVATNAKDSAAELDNHAQH